MAKNERLRSWAAVILIGGLSGLAAAFAMALVMFVLRWALGVPTPAELLGDRMAPTFSPNQFLALLQQYGGYNQLKQIGVGSVLGGQTVVAILGGLTLALIERGRKNKTPAGPSVTRTGKIFVAGFVGLLWVGTLIALWPVLSTSFIGLPPASAAIATTVGALVSYSTYGIVLVAIMALIVALIVGRPVPAEPEIPGQTVIKRRMFLAAGATAALAAAAGAALTRLYYLAAFSYDGTQYIGAEVRPITPNDRFYTVTKNVVDPEVLKPVWRLQVTGMVERSRDYAFEDLKSLPGIDQETTLMCISNWVGGGLMSNAIWKGVPLRSLIEAAGPKQGIYKVFFRAVDGYTDSILYEKAMNPTTMVAYEMNGEPLPAHHGYPVRIIVPGMFGEKNVKWVTRIELVDYDRKGFYETQGWGPTFVVPTRARFDFPYYDQTVPFASSITLKGVGFGGDQGVSRVEVSIDGGSSWVDTRLDYPGTKLSWALWSYDWHPAVPGDYKLVVRATDGTGAVQTAKERGTAPDGATGYHRVTLRLSA
ncbi:MAG TPA: molybdopterin-dependent oxidoreductase [Blastocatellia bacterium]